MSSLVLGPTVNLRIASDTMIKTTIHPHPVRHVRLRQECFFENSWMGGSLTSILSACMRIDGDSIANRMVRVQNERLCYTSAILKVCRMYLHFVGANHEVTGSCTLVEAAHKKVLADCGMYQGSHFNEGKNFDQFPFDPSAIDAVLITHAHMDHLGRVPKLVKDGFIGPIYMTKATMELARLMWEDAYSIMSYDYKKFNVPVLYEPEDIERTVKQCKGVNYHEPVDLGGITATFKDVGHIFGSAFIEIEAEGKRIAFSGDIGNDDVPILKDTERLGAVDALVCESTYGNRIHEDVETRRHIILDRIKEAAKRGGTIMIPAFSLERTQEFLYELNTLSEYEKKLPRMPIFVDSPLAINTINIIKKYPDYFDEEALKRYKHGDDFLDFPGLKLTPTKEESKMINAVKGPKMIIAGAGMMNGGRIVHHAVRYLSDPNSTLIIVGYQAEGTLGRRLYEGAKKVTIFGEEIDVKCTVQAIGALSGHADQKKIISWISGAEKLPKEVYCVHGEPIAATELAHQIKKALKIEAYVPEYGERIEL